MKKSKIYLFAAIVFLGVGLANFFTYANLTTSVILINTAWIFISGLYFYKFYKLEKTEKISNK